jgi:telomerase reverse transcriptase
MSIVTEIDFAKDILNRAPARESCDVDPSETVAPRRHAVSDSTRRVLMYIFPRQFGLHNVFTSHVNYTETSQRLQDYTLREEEIVKKFGLSEQTPICQVAIPKRLRGLTAALVQKLQVRHARCSYAELLEHYCPVCIPAFWKLLSDE